MPVLLVFFFFLANCFFFSIRVSSERRQQNFYPLISFLISKLPYILKRSTHYHQYKHVVSALYIGQMNPFAATASAGPSAAAGRQFTVLLHIDGERKILRDVTLSDTQDVMEVVALHAQLRAELLLVGGGELFPVVEYFDDRQQAFLEVTELSWPRMSAKRHIELRVDRRGASSRRQLTASRLHQEDEHNNKSKSSTSLSNHATDATLHRSGLFSGSEAARPLLPAAADMMSHNGSNHSKASTAAPHGGRAGGISTGSLKAHIVDATRRCLAREFPFALRTAATLPPQQQQQQQSVKATSMTAMPILVRICAAVLKEYQQVRGLTEAAMNESKPSSAEATTDAAIAHDVDPFVRRAVHVAVREGWLSPPPQQRSLPQQQAVAPRPPQSAASIPLERPTLLTSSATPLGQQQQLQHAAGVTDSSRQPSTARGGDVAADSHSLPAGVVPPPLLTKIDNASSVAAAAAHRVLPPRLLENDANGYYDTSAGRMHTAASVRSGGIAASSAGPGSTFQQVRYSVCGPFPPPLFGGMEDQQAPTIRVSLSAPSAAILPDADILITAHVIARTVASLTWWLGYGPQRITLNMDDMYRRGSVTTFQVSETGLLLTIRRGTLVPGWQYHVYLSASSEITGVTAADHATFLLSKSATHASSATQAASHSSEGSALKGVTSVRHLHLRGYDGDEDRGEGRAQATTSPSKAAGGIYDAPPPSTNTTGMDAANARPASIQRQQQLINLQSPSNPIGMTFQEQLKRFVVDELQPLYRLCSRPNIRQQDFNDMLHEIAQLYWYAHPPESMLDVALQREIVERVKTAVISRRSTHRAANDYRYSNNGGGGGGRAVGGESTTSSANYYGSPPRTNAVGRSPTRGGLQKSATDIPPAGLRPQYQSLIR
jgi:hypothetical protein